MVLVLHKADLVIDNYDSAHFVHEDTTSKYMHVHINEMDIYLIIYRQNDMDRHIKPSKGFMNK